MRPKCFKPRLNAGWVGEESNEDGGAFQVSKFLTNKTDRGRLVVTSLASFCKFGWLDLERAFRESKRYEQTLVIHINVCSRHVHFQAAFVTFRFACIIVVRKCIAHCEVVAVMAAITSLSSLSLDIDSQ